MKYPAARLLRSLGAVGAVGEVGEVGKEAYVPTKVTRTFVIPPLAAGVEFWYFKPLSYDLLFSMPQVCPCLASGKVHCSGKLTSQSRLLVSMSSAPTGTISQHISRKPTIKTPPIL